MSVNNTAPRITGGKDACQTLQRTFHRTLQRRLPSEPPSNISIDFFIEHAIDAAYLRTKTRARTNFLSVRDDIVPAGDLRLDVRLHQEAHNEKGSMEGSMKGSMVGPIEDLMDTICHTRMANTVTQCMGHISNTEFGLKTLLVRFAV